jgi:DUF4097 and DUF4098 domain-containing protein YvlB
MMISETTDTFSDTNALSETIENTFELSDVAAALVTIEDINGPISVEAWEQARVFVRAVKRARSRRAFERTHVEMNQEGNQIHVRTVMDNDQRRHAPARFPLRAFSGHDAPLSGLLDLVRGDHAGASVEYTIKVPAACAVSAKTVNGSLAVTGLTHRTEVKAVNGAVILKGMSGQIEAATTNGQLVAEDVSGDAELSNGNGALELRNARLTRLAAETINGSLHGNMTVSENSRYELETVNGSCQLALPPDSRCTIRMRAVNGSVKCDLPYNEISSIKRPGSRRWEAAINGGGSATIEFKTVNGSLHIGSSEGSVSAHADGETPSDSRVNADEATESRTMDILRAIERGELTVDEALKQM